MSYSVRQAPRPDLPIACENRVKERLSVAITDNFEQKFFAYGQFVVSNRQSGMLEIITELNLVSAGNLLNSLATKSLARSSRRISTVT